MAYKLEEINYRTVTDPKGFIEECDARYYENLDEAARMIAENRRYSPIVLLSGPSGSGKNEVAKRLARKKCFEKLKSYTTDASVGLQGGEWYHYITLAAFRRMCEKGEMFESTMYAGHSYGSRKADVERILESGKNVLTVMDICGAMALKTHFSNVTTIFIKRSKEQLLTDLLKKPLSVEEKVNRLMALDAEMRNAQICDYTVDMEDADKAAKEIVKGLGL